MYGCNFRCKYCFGQYGNAYKGKQRLFDEAGVASALDFFFYKAFPHALRYRLDFVSGGEPLLGIDIIKKTVSLINEFQKKSKKQVSVWLCTNASLLTDEIIEFFSDNNISIGVSLDGPRELNADLKL